jgi:hypothetical protein
MRGLSFHYVININDLEKNRYASKYDIQILDGVTGYESFYLDKYSISHYADPSSQYYGKDWCACGGTDKRWDTMWIFNSEMMEALKERIEEWIKEPWEK